MGGGETGTKIEKYKRIVYKRKEPSSTPPPVPISLWLKSMCMFGVKNYLDGSEHARRTRHINEK